MLLPELERVVISTSYLPHGWEGSVVDLIENDEIPFSVRLDLVINYELISNKLLRVFAVWCAKQVHRFANMEVLDRLLNKCEDYAYGRVERVELVHLYLQTIRELALEKKSDQLREAEDAAYSTVHTQAKVAARNAAKHSHNVLKNYNDIYSIHKKHVWKIRDLVLENLTNGEVAFIVRNIKKEDQK